MHPITVGTAGHIDHGKSALVRALTGIDPDRLAEEQRRGMTLDLGFAHLDLPGGRRIGIIDVPGHEALVHNMLAGAGGIDLVMLVVAADEGPMPQTREHLDIVRFLSIAGGLVALTKTDLVEDADWQAMVTQEIRTLVAGTALEGAPLVPVSARTGAGLPALVAALEALASRVPERPSAGPARLPVDRSFTIQGFGTVATGTLWSGRIQPGDVLALLPGGREARVRGVQVHGEPVPQALAGSRVAVNLAGIEKHEVARGDVLATPGVYAPTERLDVRLGLLPGAPPLRHSSRVHLYLGAGETVARVALLERGALQPGLEALAQLRLERPVVAVHGDRFVIRRYSPTQTIGGGMVLDAAPPRGRRRASAAAAVGAVDRSGPVALLLNAVTERGHAGLPLAAAASAAGLPAEAAARARTEAVSRGHLAVIGDRLFAQVAIGALRRAVAEMLQAYHARTPWRRGLPREDLKAHVATGPDDRLFDPVVAEMVKASQIVVRGRLVAMAGFEPTRSEEERRIRALLLARFEEAGMSPPSAESLQALADPGAAGRMLQALVDDGLVIQTGPDLRFAASVLEQVRRRVVAMVEAGQEVTVASLRDGFGTSRRYALAVLEYLDTARITRRVGDRRVLGPSAGERLTPEATPGS
jgi:selenocysteine-specific elongation factor